jgi:hypothetical protein
MIGTSIFEYIFIKTSVSLLRAVTPLSICYSLARPFFSPPVAVDIIGAWPIAETCFYFLVYLPLRSWIQRPAVHPPLLSRDERQKLFERCQENVTDPETYLSMWFRDAPASEIKRENVKEFFRWAILNTGNIDPKDDEELDGYVERLEVTLGRPLEPGRGNAECIRLTLDEINVRHRPLLWYLVSFGYSSILFWQHFNLEMGSANLRHVR